MSASFSRSSKYNLRNHNVNLKGTCLPVTNAITKHWWWCRSSAEWCFSAVALSTLCWHTERLCVCFCTCVLQGPHSKSARGMTPPWCPALSGGACWARCGQLLLLHVGCRGLASPRFPWQWPCCDSIFSSRLLQLLRWWEMSSPRATPGSHASGPTGFSLCGLCYLEVRFSPASSQNDQPLLLWGQPGHKDWSCALPSEGHLLCRAAVSLGMGVERRPP